MARARFALMLCVGLLGGAAPAPTATPIGDQPPIILSPVHPMDGQDAGGLGGLHKVEFVYPASVVSAAPVPPQLPDEIAATGSFSYLRKYGLAVLPGTDNGGRAMVRLYVYPGYTHQFSCVVGLPQGVTVSPATFKVVVQPPTQGQTAVVLSGLGTAKVSSIDSGPAMSGLVRVSFSIAPLAKAAVAAIAISQTQRTNWSFHVCAVSRKKS